MSVINESQNKTKITEKVEKTYTEKSNYTDKSNFKSRYNNYKDNKFFNNKEITYNSEVLTVDRVSCTTAGGRNMSFRAIVIVGDGMGSVGIGTGKDKEVPSAINKAERQAKKNLIKIPMYKKTISHDVEVKYGATKIVLKKAKNGTGFKAANPIKVFFTLAGVENLRSKIYGSSNKHNVINALKKCFEKNIMESFKQVANRRGKQVSEILKTTKQTTK